MTTVARLHLVTPHLNDAALMVSVQSALDVGVRCIQFRSKNATDRNRWRLAADLGARCRAADAALVINDRADIALASGAQGVHVGSNDLPPATVRAILGIDGLVGVTCRNVDDALRAADSGASYIGVGPIFRSSTKNDLPPPIGLDTLAKVAAAVPLPVIAIGGITIDQVPPLLDAGAHGVAVIAAVFGAAVPSQAAAEFLELLGESRVGPGARR